MKQLFKKKLLSDLQQLGKVEWSKTGNGEIDGNSFKQGYSNGYVKGFYRSHKITIGVFILLIISLLFNLI